MSEDERNVTGGRDSCPRIYGACAVSVKRKKEKQENY